MPLHLAIYILIVNLAEIIGKPFIFDCKQSEESGKQHGGIPRYIGNGMYEKCGSELERPYLSITISNGKATAMVTVIVNRSSDAASGSDSSNDGTNTCLLYTSPSSPPVSVCLPPTWASRRC